MPASPEFAYDVAVVGGCGHVGLPLAIAFASRGLKVAIHDIDADAVATVNAGELPFREDGAQPLLQRRWPTDRLHVTTDVAVLGEAEARRGGHRHAGRRAPEPRPARGQEGPATSAAATFRDGQLLVLRSTVYPGVTRGSSRCSPTPGWTSTWPSAPSASPRARPWRSSSRCRRSSPGRTRPSPRPRRRAVRQPHRHGRRARARGGRARQALHQHLALHQVRGGQPVLHDGQRPRPRLRPHPQGARPRLPARRRHAGRRASPPGRACSRTPCSWPRSPTTPSARPRRDAGQRGPAALPRLPARAALRPALDDGRHPRHGVQGRERRHPLQPVLQAQADPRVPGRGVLCTDPYVTVDPTLVPLETVLDRGGHPDHRRAAPRLPRPRDRPARRRRVEPARARAARV